MRRLAIPLFVFLLLIIVPAYAYEEFNYNAYLTSNTSNYFFQNDTAITVEYAASYAGLTGVMNIMDDDAIVRVYPSSINANDTFGNGTIMTYEGTAMEDYIASMILPANQEGVVSLKFRTNTTLINPNLWIYKYSGGVYTLMNNTSIENGASYNGKWINKTLIIPAAATSRNFLVYVAYQYNGTMTNVSIDRLKFYTYDKNDAIFTLLSENSMATTYCGETTGDMNTLVNTLNNASYTTVEDMTDYAQRCMVIYLNGTVFARRVAYYHIGWNEEVWRSHDGLTLVNGGSYSEYLLEGVSLTQSKITVFVGDSPSCRPTVGDGVNCMLFNGGIGTAIGLTNYSYYNNASFRQSISNNLYTNNTNPSGDSFRLCGGNTCGTYATAWFPFFSLTNACALQSVCSDTFNYQYLIGTDCSIQNIDYCGGCGCNANHTLCNYPTYIGTICDDTDVNNRDTITYFSDCATEVYQTCPVGTTCVSYTSQNPPENQTGVGHYIVYGEYESIACLNLTTSAEDICINGTGSTVACSDIVVNPSLDYCVDIDGDAVLCSSITGIHGMALTLGLLLSSQIGHDVQTAGTLLGLYIASLLGFFGLLISAKLKTGKSFQVFIIFFMFGLIFSVVAISTTMLMASFVAFMIICASMLGGYLKNIAGG